MPLMTTVETAADKASWGWRGAGLRGVGDLTRGAGSGGCALTPPTHPGRSSLPSPSI